MNRSVNLKFMRDRQTIRLAPSLPAEFSPQHHFSFQFTVCNQLQPSDHRAISPYSDNWNTQVDHYTDCVGCCSNRSSTSAVCRSHWDRNCATDWREKRGHPSVPSHNKHAPGSPKSGQRVWDQHQFGCQNDGVQSARIYVSLLWPADSRLPW